MRNQRTAAGLMMPLRHMVMRLLGPLALLQLASPAAAQSADSVLVGVLRADGIVVPYTVYAEGRWSWLPWDSIPLTIRRRDDEPWYLVRAERPPLRLGGGSVIRFTGGDTMYEEWGVVTDYCPREAGDGMFPTGRVGAVLSGLRPAVAFALVDPHSSLAERHLAFLRPHFERAEAREMALVSSGGREGHTRAGHPTSVDMRRRAPLRLMKLYRGAGAIGEGYLAYAVLRRIYPAPPEGRTSCEAISEFGAWVGEREGELFLIDYALTLDSCTEMQLSTAQPFAAVVLGERTFVLAEYSQYEGSMYAVLELDQDRLASALPRRW